jgi:hypothetical protein
MTRSLAAVCAAIVGYCLAYGAADYAKLPRPLYDPVRRVVSFGASAPAGTVINMGFFGLICWGLAGALALGALGALVGPRLLRREERAGVWAGWALLAWLVVGGYFTYANWP